MIPKETLTMFNMTKGALQGPRLLPARRCCVQSRRAPCWCSCWEPPTWGQTTTWDVGQRTRSQEQNTEQRTADFGRIESPNQLFDRVASNFLVLCHKKSYKLISCSLFFLLVNYIFFLLGSLFFIYNWIDKLLAIRYSADCTVCLCVCVSLFDYIHVHTVETIYLYI